MLRSFTGSAQGVHEARTKGERRPRGSARRHGRRGRKEDEDAKKARREAARLRNGCRSSSGRKSGAKRG